MKVVIAVAGRGTRFKELTDEIPKALIPVNGHPYLYYIIKNCLAADFSEIILITGYKAEKIEDFLKENNFTDKVKTVNQFEVLGEEKYGTACLVEAAEKEIGQEDFVLFYGDGLFSTQDLKNIQFQDNYNYIAGLKHEHPEAFGVLLKDDQDVLLDVVEKPQEFISDLISVGLHKFTPEIFAEVKKVEKSSRGEYELTDAVSALAKQKKVKVFTLKDYWIDLGRPEDMEPVIKAIKDNNL